MPILSGKSDGIIFPVQSSQIEGRSPESHLGDPLVAIGMPENNGVPYYSPWDSMKMMDNGTVGGWPMVSFTATSFQGVCSKAATHPENVNTS